MVADYEKDPVVHLFRDIQSFQEVSANFHTSFAVSLGALVFSEIVKEEDKVEQNLIKGCQSRVWLSAKLNSEGEVIFSADSDAIITKGLVALMLHILSGSQASEIAAADLYFLEKIGLNAHLSPTRSNGLASMVKQMKMYGLVFSARS